MSLIDILNGDRKPFYKGCEKFSKFTFFVISLSECNPNILPIVLFYIFCIFSITMGIESFIF